MGARSNPGAVLYGNGFGGWDAISLDGPSGDAGITVADVTGDGRNDVVSGRSVFARNAANNGFDPAADLGVGASHVGTGDLDGDGRTDVALGGGSGGFAVLRSALNDGWNAPVAAFGGFTLGLGVVDVDGDGRLDLAGANDGGQVVVATRNTANTAYTPQVIAAATGTSAWAMTAGDVNGDGRPDFAVARNGSPCAPNCGEITLFTADYDGVAPTTDDDVTDTWQATAVTVTLTANDTGGSGLDKTFVRVGTSGPFAEYDQAQRPTLQNGQTLSYYSTDKAGNAGVIETSLPAKVDGAKPQTQDDVPAIYQQTAVTVTLTAGDGAGSGVDKTYFKVGDDPFALYDPEHKPTLGDGQQISYYSVDVAGNQEDVRTSIAAKVDPTAPQTTDDVVSALHAGPVTVTLTATDTGSGVDKTYYTTGTTPATPTTSSAVYDGAHKPQLTDGTRIRYFSVDNAGNVESDHTSVAVSVDPDAPYVTRTFAPGTSARTVLISGDETYLADVAAHRIDVYDTSTGALKRSFGADDLQSAGGLALSGGKLYVADKDANHVAVFDAATGEFLRTIGDGALTGPTGVGISGASVFVAWLENGDTPRVTVFDAADGHVLGALAMPDGSSPVDIVIGGGEVFVGDLSGNVLVFDATTHAFKRSIALAAAPTGLAYSGGLLYVSDASHGLVRVIDAATGVVVRTIGDGELGAPYGLAMSATGELLVADGNPARIAVYQVPDTSAPTSTDDVPAGYVGAPVTVTLSATDRSWAGVDKILYEIGADPTGMPTTVYDPADKPTLAAGQRIRYSAIDKQGNAETPHTSAALTVDSVKPATTDSVDANWHDGPVAVTLTATDTGGSGVKAIHFTTGTNPPTPTLASAVYDDEHPPALDNAEQIRYFAVDNAGNAEADHSSPAAKVDTDAPHTTDDVPSTYRTAPVAVTLTATDDGGSGDLVTRYRIVAADGTEGAENTYDAGASKPTLGDGEKIRYFTTDGAGNAEAPQTSRAAIVKAATNYLAPTSVDGAGTKPSAPVIADLNGDGRADLAFVNPGDDTVTVLTRKGDGTYSSVTLGVGDAPRDLQVGDVNGDGRPDLVTAGASSVTVLTQNADGTYTRTDVDTGDDPRIAIAGGSIFVADGDGLTVLIADGGGGFNRTVIDASLGGDATAIAVADLNGDGIADIVLIVGGKLVIFTADGSGAYTRTEVDGLPAGADRLAIGDVDGDGKPDIVVAGDHGVVVVGQSSSGGFVVAPVGTAEGTIVGLALADLDGDGDVEPVVVTADPNSVIDYLPANGGGWTPKPVGTPTGAPNGIAIGDVDGDGRPDVIVGSDSGAPTAFGAVRDTLAPETDDDVPSTYRNAVVAVTLSATDAGGSGGLVTHYRVVSAGGVAGDEKTYSSASKPTLGDGEKLRYFTADAAGNAEVAHDSKAAKVDTETPVTADDVTTTAHTAPVEVTLTATDGGSSGELVTRYRIVSAGGVAGGEKTYDGSSGKPILANGEKLRYFTTDGAGNTETAHDSAAARVQSAAPDNTTIATRPATQTSDARPSVTFSSTDPDVTFECSLDGGPYAVCTSPYQPPADLADGAHTISVRAVGPSGLKDATPATATFTVDTAKPVAPVLISGPPSSSASTTQTLVFSGEPGASYVCALDDAPVTSCGPSVTLTALSVGAHRFRIAQVDAAGNLSAVKVVEFVITAVGDDRQKDVAKEARATLGTDGRAVTVAGQLIVGCATDKGPLAGCRAVITDKRGGILAQGTTTAPKGATSVGVTMKRTALGRRTMRRHPEGVKAIVTVTLITPTGRILTQKANTLFVSSDLVLIRTPRARTLDKPSAAVIKSLATYFKAAKAVTCRAHTSRNRRTTAAADRAMTLAQAKAACALITRYAKGPKVTTVGKGSSQPRATNETATGRGLNERVVITFVL